MRRRLDESRDAQHGASAVEYALLAALIAAVVLAVVAVLGTSIMPMYDLVF